MQLTVYRIQEWQWVQELWWGKKKRWASQRRSCTKKGACSRRNYQLGLSLLTDCQCVNNQREGEEQQEIILTIPVRISEKSWFKGLYHTCQEPFPTPKLFIQGMTISRWKYSTFDLLSLSFSFLHSCTSPSRRSPLALLWDTYYSVVS